VEKQWAEMTPEEKRAKRIAPYLNPTDIKFKSKKAERLYKERAARLLKVYMNQEPDRVPVSLPSGNFPAYYAGGNLHRAMYDDRFVVQAWLKFLQDFKDDMDTAMGPGLIYSGQALDLMDMQFLKWPGHGLGENVNSYQFVEGEYMKANEYDAMLEDPSDFALRVLLPRGVGSLKAFESLTPFSHLLGMPLGVANSFARPEIQKAFQSLIDAGKLMEKRQKLMMSFNRATLAEGFPGLRGGMAVAPFDHIGDSLRGTQGIILDMYRQPQKLLEAIDMVTPKVIRQAVKFCNDFGGIMVSFPLHKGDDTFMSDKQFEKFYWPSLKKFVDELIKEGIMVMMFAEGKYQRRLDYIHDFPNGWVHWMFDQTNMADAKRIVGKTCSISGNVPSSLMCTGTARQVKEYCRKLIETCAPGGGYLLTGGASATETCKDNLKAMMEAALEYGVYK
jgi:uroporphyrinogen-III decarboxylase